VQEEEKAPHFNAVTSRSYSNSADKTMHPADRTTTMIKAIWKLAASLKTSGS